MIRVWTILWSHDDEPHMSVWALQGDNFGGKEQLRSQPQRLQQHWSGAYTRYLLAAPIFVGHCHQTISSESGMGKNETYTFSDLPYMYNILEIIWRVEIHKRCQFSRIENKMSIAFIIRILSVTKNVVEWKYLPGIPIFSSQTYKLPELDSCCRCSFS